MADVFTKAKRSLVMSRIRSRGNRETELALARLLRANKIWGWRRHIQVRNAECGVRSLKRGVRNFCVRPDFVFRQARLAVFVDGCFWHGCPRHATQPGNNRAFWRRKLSGNKVRDALVNRELRGAGWGVLRIWEHDLSRKNQGKVIRRIQQALREVKRDA